MATRIKASSYLYDALDRLAARISAGQVAARVYYCVNTLVTEVQGNQPRRFFRAARRLLAQQNGAANTLTSALILTDRSNNAMAVATANEHLPLAYSVYGYRQSLDVLPGLPGFNGEHPDPLTGHYLLGNGYRAYNPVLMRFNSADSLSPFGKGGLNAYAYCAGDPVNRSDPSGHDLEDQIVSGLYIAAGVATSLLALAKSRPALVALRKGVKVTPPPDPLTGVAIAPYYRPTTMVEKVSTALPVAAAIASPLWFTSFVLKTQDPNSEPARVLAYAAVGIALPSLFARGTLEARGWWQKKPPVSLSRRSSEIRDDVQTRL